MSRKKIRKQLIVITNKYYFYFLISCMIISSCSKRHQYTVIRNNYHDTIYIKADTFKINPREHTIIFIYNNQAILQIDSLNKISY